MIPINKATCTVLSNDVVIRKTHNSRISENSVAKQVINLNSNYETKPNKRSRNTSDIPLNYLQKTEKLSQQNAKNNIPNSSRIGNSCKIANNCNYTFETETKQKSRSSKKDYCKNYNYHRITLIYIIFSREKNVLKK